METRNTTEDLAKAALWQGDIAVQTTHIMHLSVLDWMAVARAGQDEPVSNVIRSMLLAEAGVSQASIFGHGTALPMRAAAMANGTISHALDYDDTHFAHIGHTSVGVLPAAFAVGQARCACLDDIVEAAVIGSEIAIRVGLWLGRDHYLTGWHQTATAGAFGAAAAAGRLLGLSHDQMINAMALLGTRASGVRAQFGTMGKPWNAGIAASNGVEVALLAQAGMVSNAAGLDGIQGFGATHGQTDAINGLDGFGTDWLFDDVQHKFHACCHGIHAALEALAMLAPNQVERVDVAVNPRWMSVCNKPAPMTGLEAKFSYKHVLALALSGHNTGALDVYSDALCLDPQILELRDQMHVRPDEAVGDSAAKVSVDGREVFFDLSDPMSLEQRREKVAHKAVGLIGFDQAERVQKALATNDLVALTDFMSGT